MSAVYGPDELLCHHGDDAAGHALDPDTCPLLVKISGPSAYARPQVGGGKHTAATGTCTVCGRGGVKVTAHTVHARGPGEVVPVRLSGKGVRLGIRPQLVAHKRPERGGGPCPAVAAVPAELAYRSTAVEAWVRDYGTEHVA